MTRMWKDKEGEVVSWTWARAEHSRSDEWRPSSPKGGMEGPFRGAGYAL